MKKINWSETAYTLLIMAIGFLLGLLTFELVRSGVLATIAVFDSFIAPGLASLLGASGAYWGIRRKQAIDEEASKVAKINNLNYKLKNCLVNLCHIKLEYFDKLTTKNVRGLEIRRLLRTFKRVDPELGDKVFLADKPSTHSDFIDLNLIESSFNDYNIIIDTIERK